MNASNSSNDISNTDISGILHVSESQVTLYANAAMLKKLGLRLLEIAETRPEDFYEVHVLDAFLSDHEMRRPGSKMKPNVDVVLSEKLKKLFKAMPLFEDVDGELLAPIYDFNIMHVPDPEATREQNS